MKRFCTSVAIAAIMALGGWASVLPAHAVPPTVTPSAGYDARLQEQRSAPTVVEPAVRDPKPVSRRRVKRPNDGPH
jgi:hypothetical protein